MMHSLAGQNDSAEWIDEIIIRKKAPLQQSSHLADAKDLHLFAGKKTEVLYLRTQTANLADRVNRQVFAQIPGVFVYDMDGTGNQVNIATRGLDPHRGWEFNIRQNGFMSNTDLYGYPASHYNVPFEAVERVELVRGTGSLQYGSQFGGMLNYVTRQSDSTKRLSGRMVQSLGSYQSISSFLQLGGRSGKLQYEGYVYRRATTGYRASSESQSLGYMFQLKWQPNQRIQLNLQAGRSRYLHQMPGPLNDSMFSANPRAASRTRNYYSPDIHLPAVLFRYQLSSHTSLQWQTSAILGRRSSVMFDRSSNIPDTIQASTLAYANRQVDIDRYRSFTSEWRVLHQYQTGRSRSTLVAGMQWIDNLLRRRQQGTGSNGNDWDLRLQAGSSWGRDLRFITQNLAFFAENALQIHPKLTITSGLRIENGYSRTEGNLAYLPQEALLRRINHNFPLFGGGFSYKTGPAGTVYGSWSQAYRPILFKDVVPASVFERVSDQLRDARGYNAEIGYRASRGKWKWDIGCFELMYRHRPGTIAAFDSAGFYVLRTELGDARNRGVESFVQFQQAISSRLHITLFSSTAWMQAVYVRGSVRRNTENFDISGNEVESVPRIISRNQISLASGRFRFNLLHSYTAKSFADALNSIQPDASGSVGLVPAYTLWDFTLAVHVSKLVLFSASVNNLTNRSYFTKRPQLYPGPGIWPSDGRTVSSSLLVKF